MSEKRRLALYAWRRHCMLSLGETKVLLQSARSSPGAKACPQASTGQLLLRRQDSSFTMLPDGSTAKSALSCSCSSTAESVGRACRVHMQLRVFSLNC